jgi:hypothetical protein
MIMLLLAKLKEKDAWSKDSVSEDSIALKVILYLLVLVRRAKKISKSNSPRSLKATKVTATTEASSKRTAMAAGSNKTTMTAFSAKTNLRSTSRKAEPLSKSATCNQNVVLLSSAIQDPFPNLSRTGFVDLLAVASWLPASIAELRLKKTRSMEELAAESTSEIKQVAF